MNDLPVSLAINWAASAVRYFTLKAASYVVWTEGLRVGPGGGLECSRSSSDKD